jgi:hypothetical protein
MANWLPEDKAIAVVAWAFDAKDASSVAMQQLILRVWTPQNTRLWLRVCYWLLDHPNEKMRLDGLARFRTPTLTGVEKAGFIKRLLKMMEDGPIPERRGAAIWLMWQLKDNGMVVNPDGVQDVMVSSIPFGTVGNGNPPLPETPAEVNAFKTIREAAEKWLRESGQ